MYKGVNSKSLESSNNLPFLNLRFPIIFSIFCYVVLQFYTCARNLSADQISNKNFSLMWRIIISF
jgi:hypothetical protein